MFDVLLHDKLVGCLEPRGRGIRFTYAAEALDEFSIPPLSLSLPKRAEPYADSVAGAFFRNLLPEQAYRRLVVSTIGSATENDLALLGAIGGECPGAVSIWPVGERPSSPPKHRSLSEGEIEGLFSAGGQGELAAALTRGRLSLAGAMEKIALLRDSKGWWLPLNGAITSHILKQAAVRFEHLLENELFCSKLANVVDLGVSSVGLVSKNVRVFQAERYDRVMVDGDLTRLHQEDFCQALGIDPSRKYQHDGGPGIKNCARTILRYSAAPVIDLDRLVSWVGFNYLIGNEDAHAKNLAFLHTSTGTTLAPFYDIVSTTVYEGLERRMSMKIGRAWDGRNVQGADWRLLARHVDLPWPAVREILSELADRVSTSLPDANATAFELYGHSSIYESITKVVTDRLAQLDRQLARKG